MKVALRKLVWLVDARNSGQVKESVNGTVKIVLYYSILAKKE